MNCESRVYKTFNCGVCDAMRLFHLFLVFRTHLCFQFSCLSQYFCNSSTLFVWNSLFRLIPIGIFFFPKMCSFVFCSCSRIFVSIFHFGSPIWRDSSFILCKYLKFAIKCVYVHWENLCVCVCVISALHSFDSIHGPNKNKIQF